MAKYQKKPVVVPVVKEIIQSESIEAVRFDPNAHWPDGVISWKSMPYQPRDMSWGFVQTREGKKHVQSGDWIITGATGEKDVCNDATFKQTYERVED